MRFLVLEALADLLDIVLGDQLRSRIGHKRVTREITDFFAAGGALLLLGGGTLSAFWFRRVP